jgi:hypothetical protein
VALKYSMSSVFGVPPGETFFAASDIGWVVGHSYIVYGPLIHGAASVLFEGKPVGTPDAAECELKMGGRTDGRTDGRMGGVSVWRCSKFLR